MPFKNGTVTNGGPFRGTSDWPSQNGGNKFGIEIDAVDSSIEFRDVKVVSPHNSGVSGVASRIGPDGKPTNGVG